MKIKNVIFFVLSVVAFGQKAGAMNMSDANRRFFRAVTHGGAQEITRMINEDGIDINVKNRFGETALNKAAMLGFDDVVTRLLEEEDILVNEKNDRGYSPLHNAVRFVRHKIFVALLKDPRVLVNEKNGDGETVLYTSTVFCWQRFLAELLKNPKVLVNEKYDGDKMLWEIILSKSEQCTDSESKEVYERIAKILYAAALRDSEDRRDYLAKQASVEEPEIEFFHIIKGKTVLAGPRLFFF